MSATLRRLDSKRVETLAGTGALLSAFALSVVSFQDILLFSRQHVRLASGTSDQEGLLIYAHGELTMVLVRLDDWSHGRNRGHWLVKAAFGDCSDAGPGLFNSPESAEEWAHRRHALLHAM
jgi:hypothetical protein